jgi:tripeptidyl-peptidase-2
MQVQSFVVTTELAGEGKAALLKEAKIGDVLLGRIHVSPKAGDELGTSLRYVIPPPAPKDKTESDGDKDKPSLVDLQLGLVSKLTDEAEKTAFIDSLVQANPGHLPALVAKLDSLKEKASPADVVAAADAILAAVGEEGEDELARYLGVKQPPASEQTENEKTLKKQMDVRKDALRKAYSRKTSALLEQGRDTAEIDTAFVRYRRWVESPESDPPFALANIKRELSRGRYGVALTAALKLIKEIGQASGDAEANEAAKLKAEAISKVGWPLWIEEEARFALVRKPPSGYAPF